MKNFFTRLEQLFLSSPSSWSTASVYSGIRFSLGAGVGTLTAILGLGASGISTGLSVGAAMALGVWLHEQRPGSLSVSLRLAMAAKAACIMTALSAVVLLAGGGSGFLSLEPWPRRLFLTGVVSVLGWSLDFGITYFGLGAGVLVADKRRARRRAVDGQLS